MKPVKPRCPKYNLAGLGESAGRGSWPTRLRHMQSNLCYKQVSQLSKGTRSSLRNVFKKGGIITGGLVDPSDLVGI